jgi:hypothetical protein
MPWLALWKKLACLLDHPQLELSNNLAEEFPGVNHSRRRN